MMVWTTAWCVMGSKILKDVWPPVPKHIEEQVARLEAKVERLLRLIYVHVDPTGYEDDPDMQMAMAELQKREQDG